MKASIRQALVFVSIVALPMALSAQEDEPPVPTRAQERIEQFKKIRMMEVLALDEQSAIKFFARYDRHQRILKGLRLTQLQATGLIQRLRKNKASEAEFDKAIRELQSQEYQVSEAKQKFMDELREVLTSRQLAEYLVFELRFQQNLRDLVREVQRNRNAPLKW